MIEMVKAILVFLGLLLLLLALVSRLASRWLLRFLLSRHDWMQLRKSSSWRVTAWSGLVKLLLGNGKKTYEFESSLPSLPIPRLQESIIKYLASIKPLLSTAEYEAHVEEVNSMVVSDGFWLQVG